jgi:5S rRNA maturation endonuclease (ribonuclease M5)
MPENRVLKTLEKYRIKNQNIPIIVEGKNDLSCLRSLEFQGNIIILNTGNSLVNFSENIAGSNDEVIILTDFDRKGVEIKKNIQRYMTGLGCRVDTDLWDTLRRYVPIRTVEELPFAVQRIVDNLERKEIDGESIKRRWNS